MEKRYCDMDKLAEDICSCSAFTEDESNKFIFLLWQQSQVESVERISKTICANWLKKNYMYSPDMDVNIIGFQCSSCRNVQLEKSKYCPECGARMENYNKSKE